MPAGDSGPEKEKLPKGVARLARPRGGRAFRAAIRQGKGNGIEVHLGLYETRGLAALAYATAAGLLGRGVPTVHAPTAEEPTAEEVRAVVARVRRRLGIIDGPARRDAVEAAPATEDLLTFFEVIVVGFWRGQASADDSDHPDAGLDAAARRLASSASLLFWSRSSGHPDPLDAMTELVARRLGAAFRRPDVTRAVLDDDGDEPWRVARWLVLPDVFPGRRARGFREEVRRLYAESFKAEHDDDDDGNGNSRPPGWALLLGLTPPFVRAAYRTCSRAAHPDAGGSDSAFIRLRAAYEEALAYLAARDH